MISSRKSGGGCSAIGCTMRRNTNLLSQVKMFRFPKDPVRRASWCNAMKRDNWNPTNNSLICNAHFVTGKPSSDSLHPDYVPSIFNFNQKGTVEGEKKLKRYERTVKRMRHDSLSGNSGTINVSEEAADTVNSEPDVSSASSSNMMKDASTQTDMFMKDIVCLEKKLERIEEENTCFRKRNECTKTYNSIVNYSDKEEINRKIFKFYTGVQNFEAFNMILSLILSIWQPEIKVALKPCEQLLLVLMKLRLGLLNQDLACRFEIGVGTVSTVFHSWLNIMHANLNRLILWPSRTQIKRNMPQCYRGASLEDVRCIIDCTEIFIEKPHNFKARAQTYSNYKNHNTVKILLGITPSGIICFLSKAWGGRVSDRHLTVQSGFLNCVEKGDMILADRGFKIEDLFLEKEAKLIIPSSTKNKKQLSAAEVRQSRNMSKVRVHVERAIRKIKTYKILNANVPITLIKRNNDGEYTTIDKILTVICALCNLSNPIIKS